MVSAIKDFDSSTSGRRNFVRRIERRVLAYVHEHGVLHSGERVLIAVSGGPDSSALLTILHRLSKSLTIELLVGHFNHRLRGENEARADLAYVASLAHGYGLPLVHGAGDVKTRARKRGESLEDAARRLRYAFLAREAKAAGASVVLTGHTMDDQAETVLLHITRGSGLDGLAGMRSRSGWPFRRGPDLARPLLCLHREDTEHYCREMDLEPRRDDTNELLTATRNRVRLRILPELRAVNPRVVDALARLADAAASDSEYLSDVARHEFERVAKSCAGSFVLQKRDLVALPLPIQARIVQRALEGLAGGSGEFERVHIEGVIALATKSPGRLSLPHEMTAASDSGCIYLGKTPMQPVAPLPETALTIPGVTTVGDWHITCEIVATPPNARTSDRFEAHLDPGHTRKPLTVRSRRPGDRLRPLGLGGQKKLQDILVDAKVPARKRDEVPIVSDDVGVLWIVGHCLDERAAVMPTSGETLRITAERLIPSADGDII